MTWNYLKCPLLKTYAKKSSLQQFILTFWWKSMRLSLRYSGRFIANSAHFQRPFLRNKVGDFFFFYFRISNSSANSTREIKKKINSGKTLARTSSNWANLWFRFSGVLEVFYAKMFSKPFTRSLPQRLLKDEGQVAKHLRRRLSKTR